jgi:hypothetical protein
LIDHSLFPRLGLLDLYYFQKPPADLQVCLIAANSGRLIPDEARAEVRWNEGDGVME